MIKKILSTLKEYNYNQLNFRLIIYVATLTVIGILAIGSATVGESYQSKQIAGMIVGLCFMVALMLISYKFIMLFYWPLYILTLVLLLAVEIFGKMGMGAKRWFEIAGIQFQPSEISKILLLLFLAAYINKFKDRFNTFKVLIPMAILLATPLLLIFMEPDLSTTIVIFLALSTVIYLAGLHYKIIVSILCIALPMLFVFGYILMFHPEIQILNPYQHKRFIGFYSKDDDDPEIIGIRYQQENALLAIGSGGLTGKGLYNDDETSVKNGNLLPESHTDFIFTIIGEELGFVGCTAVIILILLIVLECFLIGAKVRDLGGRLYCFGFGSILGIQSMTNIAVNTMLLPNTGLTLPFVSYGLTSLLSMYIGIGIVLNVGLNIKNKLY